MVAVPKLRESQRDLREEDHTKQSEMYPVNGGHKIPYKIQVLSCWKSSFSRSILIQAWMNRGRLTSKNTYWILIVLR